MYCYWGSVVFAEDLHLGSIGWHLCLSKQPGAFIGHIID